MKEISVKEFLGEVLLITIQTLILGLCVMFLWNYNISIISPGISTLTYPQAVGLYALCKILFTYKD